MSVSENASRGSVRYVLATAAFNEEAYIEKALLSVAAQTVRPQKWVIVSDGSTDGTDAIVVDYAKRWPYIELVRMEAHRAHDFASKVRALNMGLRMLGKVPFDFIGNLDGDVSFGPRYFEELLERFERDPALGVAGGGICEWDGTAYRPRKHNTAVDVAGAVQMFRRRCYEAVGEFLPLGRGGEDWYAQVMARMHGWGVESFAELEVRHHRVVTKPANILRYCFRQGLMDFSLGSHPLFEAARLGRRAADRPWVLNPLARLCGFLWGYSGREKRIVSKDFVRFLRKEQMAKLGRFGLQRYRRFAEPAGGGERAS